MRRLLPALAVVALVGLLMWWGCGEEPVRSARTDAPLEWEEPEPAAPGEDAAHPAAMKPPPDSVETGECAVFLRVVDADTGRPVASNVGLWRLDAPGNDGWTAGDQLQLTAEVPVEGVRLEGLPAADYRPVCLAERFSADDPRPMRVEGPLTELTIPIAMRRKIRARVRVVDLRGEMVPEGRVLYTGQTHLRRRRAPAWVRPRALRDGSRLPLRGRVGGGTTIRGGNRQVVAQPPEGFEIGPFDEDSKESEVTYIATVEVEGRSSVRVAVPCAAGDGQAYVALSVPLADVTDGLRMPDGRTIAEAGGEVSASFPAVALDPSVPPPFLVDVPFEIDVRVPGYESASLKRRLGDPPPALVLEPEAED